MLLNERHAWKEGSVDANALPTHIHFREACNDLDTDSSEHGPAGASSEDSSMRSVVARLEALYHASPDADERQALRRAITSVSPPGGNGTT